MSAELMGVVSTFTTSWPSRGCSASSASTYTAACILMPMAANMRRLLDDLMLRLELLLCQSSGQRRSLHAAAGC